MKGIAIVAVTVSSLALAGCQSLFGLPSFAAGPQPARLETSDLSDYFSARLEAGRLHLANGRPTQAITAFRQAAYDPALAAQAHNGMGVAYAQIGREDLARQYFTMAAASDPSDERFARNLARLEQGAGSIPAQLGSSAPVQQAQLDPLAPGQPVPVAEPDARQSSTGLARVTDREVRIDRNAFDPDRSVSIGQLAERANDQRLRPAPVAAAYPVRVRLPDAGASQRSGYPVRIALSDTRVVEKAQYPIRVELPAGK